MSLAETTRPLPASASHPFARKPRLQDEGGTVTTRNDADTDAARGPRQTRGPLSRNRASTPLVSADGAAIPIARPAWQDTWIETRSDGLCAGDKAATTKRRSSRCVNWETAIMRWRSPRLARERVPAGMADQRVRDPAAGSVRDVSPASSMNGFAATLQRHADRFAAAGARRMSHRPVTSGRMA